MNTIKNYDKKLKETFCYTFSSQKVGDNYTIEVSIDIPFEGSIQELGHRIINGFNLPLYVIEGNYIGVTFFTKILIICYLLQLNIDYILLLELCNELQKFIDKCSITFYDRQTVDAIDNIKNETIEIEDIVKYWEKAFEEVCYIVKLFIYMFTYV